MKIYALLFSLLVGSSAFAQPIDDDVKIQSVHCHGLQVENAMYANVGQAVVKSIYSQKQITLKLWVDRWAEDADVLADKLCQKLQEAQKTNATFELTYDIWLDGDDTLQKFIVAE